MLCNGATLVILVYKRSGNNTELHGAVILFHRLRDNYECRGHSGNAGSCVITIAIVTGVVGVLMTAIIIEPVVLWKWKRL